MRVVNVVRLLGSALCIDRDTKRVTRVSRRPGRSGGSGVRDRREGEVG